MTDNEKITLLDKIEKKWLAVSLAVGMFIAGFAVGHAVGDHTANTVEERSITASAEELPQFTFNYMLDTMLFTGSSSNQTITPFSYVYDPARASVGYYGTWIFVNQTSVNTTLANYPQSIVNNPYSLGGVNYSYSLSNSVLRSAPASFIMANGQSAINNSYVALRVFTDFNDFSRIDTTSYPSITVRLTRPNDAETLFPMTSVIGYDNVVYQSINIKFKSLDDTPLNMLMVFPMAMRSTVTAFDNASWYYSQGIGDNYNNGYANGIEYADSRVNADSSSYKAGFERGKIEGASSANDYSFNGLFYAIFDAPLKVIQEGLNFEILGINLASFILSIITVVIVVAVVKFLLR